MGSRYLDNRRFHNRVCNGDGCYFRYFTPQAADDRGLLRCCCGEEIDTHKSDGKEFKESMEALAHRLGREQTWTLYCTLTGESGQHTLGPFLSHLEPPHLGIVLSLHEAMGSYPATVMYTITILSINVGESSKYARRVHALSSKA